MNIKESSISLTVNRTGVIDLLVKTKQALELTAGFMRSSGMVIDSIVTHVLSAYIETLAAAMEQDLDEQIVQQLKSLVIPLAVASGDPEIDEQSKILDHQIDQFTEVIRQIKGMQASPDDEPLMIMGPDDIM